MPTRVLVIEDNPADLRLLQEALFEVGAFNVKLTGVDTLRRAIVRLETDTFDAALLDLSLPDTDGLNGLERLQTIAPELPIVVLTGHDDSELAVRAVREGAQDYLVKGQVDGHLLVRAMRYAEERKRAVLDLKRSEERFRSLLENALDIISVFDVHGRIEYSSPSVERVLGYSPGELGGTSVLPLVHPEDAARISNAIGSLTAGRTTRAECRVRHKNGTWRVIEAIGRSLVDDPVVSGIVVNARDITERQQAEEQLRDTNGRLQALIEASPLAIYVLDLEGRVQAWNSAAESMFGWSESDVLLRELPTVHPEAHGEFLDRLEQVRAGIKPGTLESRYVRKDGVVIHVNIWSALLCDESGLVTGLVALVADITERRRLEDQFRQAQKMEAVGRLAGGVAHDFNNLLTVISGYSQLASNRLPAGSPIKSDLQEVLQAAERAASLTRQLLVLSRRQVGELVSLDLNALVVEMERMLRRVIGEDVHLETRLSSSLASVRADRGQIELVLLNLAVNARDAMPNGGRLVIETANARPGGDSAPVGMPELSGPCVMLAVSDTGTGMSPQTRARLFEPFFTTKEPGKGTGLGLSTSYGIVRQHGGDIWVESEPDVGATFRVFLPAVAPAARPEAPASAHKASPSPTILLVEPDAERAKAAEDALRNEGYRILLAADIGQALETAASSQKRIHLVIADLVLRSGHGVDLEPQIGALQPGIRILYLAADPEAAKPLQGPMVSLLRKPATPAALASKVREVLSDNKQSGTGTSWTESGPG
jgi:two-component system cell cycle sensor histidine kinase/response regulator CckA